MTLTKQALDGGPALRAPGAGRRRGFRVSAPVLILVVLLLVLVGYPLVLLLGMSLNTGDPSAIPPRVFGLANYGQLGTYLRWLGNSLVTSVLATIASVALGAVLAWILHRTTIAGRRALEFLVYIPFPMGSLVAAFAWIVLGQPVGGLINQAWTAVTGLNGPLVDIYSEPWLIAVMAIVEAPLAVLIIGANLQRMDSSLEESSLVLGRGHFRTAAAVTFPLMLPAVSRATLFIFATMMGSFELPALIGPHRFYTTTTGIFNMFNQFPPNYPVGAMLGVILVAITGIVVWGVGRIIRNRSYPIVTGRGFRPGRMSLGRWRYLTAAIVYLYIGVALVLPLLSLLLAALQPTSVITLRGAHWTLANFDYVLFQFPTTEQAIVNSLILGAGCATIVVPLAVLVAWVVQRSRGFGKGVLEQLTMIPQSTPRLIFAIGLLWAVLSIPLPLYGSLLAILISYVIVFLPLAYQSVSGSVTALDRQLEDAARMSGARMPRVIRTVTAPLLTPGMIAAWALVFMSSMREVSTAIFLAGPGTNVLGPAIFDFWESGGLGKTSALVVVQAAITGVTLIVVQILTRRRIEL